MADQLTSVGVEFSKSEMARVFYSVSPGVEIRKWGFGKTKNPTGLATYPDKIYTAAALPWRKMAGLSTQYTPRKPGMYTADGNTEPLSRPNELVHPCVRIRYLYGGLELDDAGDWQCRALTDTGYKLVSQKDDTVSVRPSRMPGVVKTYETVNSSITPYYDTVPHPFDATQTYVRAEQPYDKDDLYQLPAPTTHWVWKHKDGKTMLPEEHIGMWERMFIKINAKMLGWQEQAKGRKTDGAIKASGTAASSWFGGSAQAKKRELPAGAAPEYGYHDMVSWQQADATKNTGT